MSKCPPQIQTYYTRYVHATYSRAGVLARNVQQEFFVTTSIMCGAYAPRICVTYVLNVDIFPRRSFGAQRTTRIFRPYVDHVRCVRATYAWPTCWMLGIWVEWKQILFWGKTYKNLSIHAEIFPIFPAYKSTLRAGDAYVAPTRHVGASKHGENPTTRVV